MTRDATFGEMIDWYSGLDKYIKSSPEFSPLHGFLESNTSRLNDYSAWRAHFVPLLNRSLFSDDDRELVVKAILDFTHKKLGVPRAPLVGHPKIQEMANQIRELGHLTLPPFPAEQVQVMKSYFEKQLVYSPDKSSLLPIQSDLHANVAEYPARTVVECPHLMETASNPALLSIVEEYLGAPPTVVIATAWWSFTGKPEPKEAQLFHFDYADFRFVNLFIYLTDVDMEGGPHVYMEGTHTMSKILRIINNRFSAEEIQKFMEWYSHSLRKSDEDVLHYMQKAPKYFTGPAGTMFLADTRGLHKGLLPKKSDRLLAQFTYALTPAIQSGLDLAAMKPGVIPSRLQEGPFNYACRLLVDTPRNIRYQ